MEVKKIQVAFKDPRGEIFDILENVEIDSVSLIKSKKAKRGNHFHQETIQYIYMISGKMRILSQMSGEELVRIMVDADMEALGLEPPREGKAALMKHGLNMVDRALINPTGGMES